MTHIHIVIAARWIIVRFVVGYRKTKTPGRELPPGERVLAFV